MKQLFVLMLVCAMTAVPSQSHAQNLIEESMFLAGVFGLGIPALPVLAGMSDVYGLAEFSMGLGFTYGALIGDIGYLNFGVPMLISSVYLIRYDTKMEPLTHLMGHTAVWFASSLVTIGALNSRQQFPIEVRPHPLGATLTVRF